MFHRAALALVVALVADAAAGTAQDTVSRRGFWLSMGGGGGWNDGMRGAAGCLRMGGTPSEHVLFGGQVFRWWRVDDYEVLGRTSATATVQIFPLSFGSNGRSPMSNWHLKAGFGLATADQRTSGVAVDFGTGIDLRMDGKFFVTPGVDVLIQVYRNLTNTMLAFTMGLTWY